MVTNKLLQIISKKIYLEVDLGVVCGSRKIHVPFSYAKIFLALDAYKSTHQLNFLQKCV